jgi:hypothetical protein
MMEYYPTAILNVIGKELLEYFENDYKYLTIKEKPLLEYLNDSQMLWELEIPKGNSIVSSLLHACDETYKETDMWYSFGSNNMEHYKIDKDLLHREITEKAILLDNIINRP